MSYAMEPDDILDFLFDKNDGIIKDQHMPFDSLGNISSYPNLYDNVQFDEILENILGNGIPNFDFPMTPEQNVYSRMKTISDDHGYSKPIKAINIDNDEENHSVNITIPQIEDSFFSSDNGSPNSDSLSDTSFTYNENHSPLSQAVELLDLDNFYTELNSSLEQNVDEPKSDEIVSLNLYDTSSEIYNIWNDTDDDHSTQDFIMTDKTSSNTPVITLSDEEKLLLKREGITIPSHLPLTKSEERAIKTVRRKIRNKISAKESRQRKCLYVDGLEKRVEACTKHNSELQKKVDNLEKQNMTLKAKFLKLQAFINNGNKSTQPSTCLMVLMLSLALLVTPNLNMFNEENEIINEKQAVMPGRSRNILQHRLEVNNILNDEPIVPPNGLSKSKVVYKSIINPEIFKKAGEMGSNTAADKFHGQQGQPPDLNYENKTSMVHSWIQNNFDESNLKVAKSNYTNITNAFYNMSSFNELKANDIILDHNYTQILSK